jgi:hypothetical protein
VESQTMVCLNQITCRDNRSIVFSDDSELSSCSIRLGAKDASVGTGNAISDGSKGDHQKKSLPASVPQGAAGYVMSLNGTSLQAQRSLSSPRLHRSGAAAGVCLGGESHRRCKGGHQQKVSSYGHGDASLYFPTASGAFPKSEYNYASLRNSFLSILIPKIAKTVSA